MRLALSAEQQELRDVVAQLLTDRCPPTVVRTGSASAETTALAKELADLGTGGLLVPEGAGGLGLTEDHLVPILTEVGRRAVPLPLVETWAVAPTVLIALADAEPLDAIISGALVAADPAGRGRARFAAPADLLLSGGFGGFGSITVHDLTAAGRTDLAAVDPPAGLQQLTGGSELGVVDDPDVVLLAWQRGVVGASAELLGLARAMLDLTVAYVGERRQFGVPIGSFQAVKHHLADASIALEFAGPMVATAGHLLGHPGSAGDGPDTAQAVAAAKIMASEAALGVGRLTGQCLGAIGYTTEFDWQLYAKRAWATAAAWGSPAYHRHTVAVALDLPGVGPAPAH